MLLMHHMIPSQVSPMSWASYKAQMKSVKFLCPLLDHVQAQYLLQKCRFAIE